VLSTRSLATLIEHRHPAHICPVMQNDRNRNARPYSNISVISYYVLSSKISEYFDHKDCVSNTARENTTYTRHTNNVVYSSLCILSVNYNWHSLLNGGKLKKFQNCTWIHKDNLCNFKNHQILTFVLEPINVNDNIDILCSSVLTSCIHITYF